MNDVREMLRAKADEMTPNPRMPETLRKRARRRRVGNALLSTVLVAGLGVAAFAGARELVGDRAVGPRPAQQPQEGTVIPIWPSIGLGSSNVAAIDGIQQQVDEGHQPWRMSPQIVGEVFGMEVMKWERGDVEASVRGDDPVTVAIANPSLADAMGDVRTLLTLERWRGREDGIFVVTHVETDILKLRSPVPQQEIAGVDEVTFAGSLQGISQRLLGLEIAPSIEGGFSFGTTGDLPSQGETTEEGEFTGSPSGISFQQIITPGPDGEFEAKVSMPDDVPANPGVSVFVQSLDGKRIAAEAFRLGPATPLPPLPHETVVLPPAVMETRDAIQVAANDRDWDALEALIDRDRFEFTFGGERDPIPYWKRLERDGTPVRRILATLLSYPATEYMDLYMWPTAAPKPPGEWTEADLEPLAQIYTEKELEQMRGGDSYYGWRVGIEADGTWIFFVAGD